MAHNSSHLHSNSWDTKRPVQHKQIKPSASKAPSMKCRLAAPNFCSISAESSPGCQRWKSRKSSEDKEQICECNLHLEHETEVQTLEVSFFHYKNYKRETNTASDCSHIEPRVKILQKMALQGWCCVIVHSVDLCHGSLVAVRQHKGEQGRGKVTKPLWGSWRGTQCRNGQTTDSCLCHFPAHSTSLTETSLDSCIPLILSVAMAAPWRLLKTV